MITVGEDEAARSPGLFRKCKERCPLCSERCTNHLAAGAYDDRARATVQVLHAHRKGLQVNGAAEVDIWVGSP